MSGRLPAPLDMKGIDEDDVDAAMSSLSVSKENTPMAANDDASVWAADIDLNRANRKVQSALEKVEIDLVIQAVKQRPCRPVQVAQRLVHVQ